jgi:hypothetical protein
VVVAGGTELRYHVRCIDDLPAMLAGHGEWMPLGLDEVEHNARDNRMRATG